MRNIINFLKQPFTFDDAIDNETANTEAVKITYDGASTFKLKKHPHIPPKITPKEPSALEIHNDLALSRLKIDANFSVTDLKTLADLNQIKLQIAEGWYPLVIKLILELDKLGWNRKVTCIKERYHVLEFYTDHKYYDLIESFREKSQNICMKCGERGKTRRIGCALCRKHYMELVGTIVSVENGFLLGDVFYKWADVVGATFMEARRINEMPLELTFKMKLPFSINPYEPHRLLIHSSNRGFAHFLSKIPSTFNTLDYYLIDRHFKQPEDCEICGFKAVYNAFCECCENEQWESLEKNNDEKESHIKFNQLYWQDDTQGQLEVENAFYAKSETYTALYTAEELEDFFDLY